MAKLRFCEDSEKCGNYWALEKRSSENFGDEFVKTFGKVFYENFFFVSFGFRKYYVRNFSLFAKLVSNFE